MKKKKTQIHHHDKHISGKFSRGDKGRRKETLSEKKLDACSQAGTSLSLCFLCMEKILHMRATRAAGSDTVPMQNLPAAMQFINLGLANIMHDLIEKKLHCSCSVD